MSAGWIRRAPRGWLASWVAAFVLGLGSTSCDRPELDPPPPVEPFEVPTAPPGAVGAYPAFGPPLPMPESSPDQESEPDPDVIPEPPGAGPGPAPDAPDTLPLPEAPDAPDAGAPEESVPL